MGCTLKIKPLILAAASVGALTLSAATPVAVWDGDFTVTQTGYTLNLNDNDLSSDNSTITISQNVGVTVTKDEDTFSGGFTVLVRYSDLNTALADKQVLATSTLTDANDRTGVTINKSGMSCGIWDGGSWNSSGTYNSMTSDQSSGVLAFEHYSTTSYTGGAGTMLFSLGRFSAASTTIMNAGTLGSNNDKSKYKSFAIGGRSVAADGFSGATGMKISGIAVFSGILTEQEMLDYRWPTDVSISVDENTSVSVLNSQFSQKTRAFLSVAGGVTLTTDEEFAIPVAILSEGSISLSAGSQPDASYFSNVDFSGVQGGVFRTWLPTPGVVGFNFNANGGRNGQGNTDGAADTSLALENGTWHKDAYSPSGTSTAMFADGVSLLTWQAENVYAETGDLTDGTFIQGYLDDAGSGVAITLSAIPYETYDIIIYCSTDESSKSFKAKTVNGNIYTWDATTSKTITTDSENATWGLASEALGKAIYGANTLRINNLTGPLYIKGGTNGNNARGCISAFQIMPAGTSTAPEMTVGTAGQTTQATWTAATWNVATAPTSGNVVINVAGDVELTIDETVALSTITITGEGSLKIIPDQPNSVTFTAGSVLSPIPLVFANDGIGIDTVSAPVTYLYRTTSINSSAHGNTYAGGSGTSENAVAINHNGGSVTLDGTVDEPFYLAASANATETSVIFTNATANYGASLGVGMASYIVAGHSVINIGAEGANPQSFVLSQGAANRTASFLLKDDSVVNVLGTNDVDSNQATIMFGHWNGPSTFTIQDSAKFNASSDVLVGKTRNDHTININGGTFTANGIKASATATGTNTLNLNGGSAVLGESGITSYGSTVINVNVRDDSEIRASAATTPITQPVSFTSGTTLSFTKADSLASARVDLTGAVSGTGGISVGAGVTLSLGINRSATNATFTVDGVLALALTSKTDAPVFKVSKEPAKVTVYDTDGTTELGDKAAVVYDAVAGTITVRLNTNTWNVSDDFSFDNAANWSSGLPGEGQELSINATGDVTLTIAGNYTAESLVLVGGGTIELEGAGSLAVKDLYLYDGTKLKTGGRVSVTGNVELDSGTELQIHDPGNCVFTGAGTLVLDPGDGNTVTMSKSNTSFTGEAVIASGTVKMGDARSFGEFNRAASVRVKTGATLDVNGVTSGDMAQNNKLILEEGAVYTNTVRIDDSKMYPFYDLTLEGNATIDAGSVNNGLTRHYNRDTYVHLGANTLTKTGTNTFYMSATTIDGTGTIDVTEGVLSMARAYDYYSSTQPSISNGTIIVRSGAGLEMQDYSGGSNLTAKKIILEGAARVSGKGSVIATDGVELRTVENTTTDFPTLLSDGTSVSATGNGTLAFGTVRPTTSVDLGDEVKITVQMQNSADAVIELLLSREPVSVLLYDENGNVDVDASHSYDTTTQTLTIRPGVITLEATSGEVDFDDPQNWNKGRMPSISDGDDIVLIATGDVTLNVNESYTLGSVSISGGGSVTFAGNGSITPASISIGSGTSLIRHSGLIDTSNFIVESGAVLILDAGDGTLTESAAISGAGAVETYGDVTFNASNTFTGGLTVKFGSEARSIKTGIGGQAYGKNNYGQAVANLSRIVVEDGGSLDLANTADACYAITISGKGVYDAQSGTYKGALYNSGSEIGQNSRQTASLTLAADAMVKAESVNNGWGLVNSGHAATVLALNGHTLTVSGAGYFPIVNANTASGTQTTGTLIADGVTLGLVSTACNFAGVDIIARGCATINIETAPSAIGSLTLKPTVAGMTASNWNLPSGFVPALDTSNVDSTGLSVGDELTLFTAPSATVLTEETILVNAGGRYTTTISGNTVTVTVKAPANFMHYDFNAENSIATDSKYNFGNLNPSFVTGKNGMAGVFDSSDRPYYDSNNSNKSPFYAGEMTVTALLKIKEADNTILWNFGSGWGVGMALIAKDSSTISVVSWTGGADGSDVVSLTGIADLMNKWHLVTIVANAMGTTLYVDGTSATVDTVLPDAIGGQGQFGSIHGTVKNYNAVADEGYLLDDWRVYDAALSTKEVRRVKASLLPQPFRIFIR